MTGFIGPALIGLLGAIMVLLPRFLRGLLPGFPWFLPVTFLGFTFLVAGFHHLWARRKTPLDSYDGLPDLFIHVHSPANPESSIRWVIRGVVSFGLALFGATVGTEGAAIEFSKSVLLRKTSKTSRWSENRRRTDAAVALATGISAAFAAPFAAVVMPIELGLGGSAINTVIASVSAFFWLKFFDTQRFFEGWVPNGLSAEHFDITGVLFPFRLSGARDWIGVLAVTLAVGLFATALIRFIRYCKESVADLFRGAPWMKVLGAGFLLFLVMLIYKGGHEAPQALLEAVLWDKKAPLECGLLVLSLTLTLALVLSAFGSSGVIWPVFVLGGVLSVLVDQWALGLLPGHSSVAGLVGASAMLGAVLGAPLAGSLLAFELTGNYNILLPCLLASFGAVQIRKGLGTRSLIELDLEARGLHTVHGRSLDILKRLTVQEAMVTDHQSVLEHDPVTDLHSRLIQSRYPFLPVVSAQGKYAGLLTLDMVEDAWHSDTPEASHSPLSKLLEAKDLLYRSKVKAPTVKSHDSLSLAQSLFEEYPCIPVIDDERRVIGLLFVHNVRLAYDREAARQSMI